MALKQKSSRRNGRQIRSWCFHKVIREPPGGFPQNMTQCLHTKTSGAISILTAVGTSHSEREQPRECCYTFTEPKILSAVYSTTLSETHIKEHRMTWKEPVVAYFKVLALISLAVLQKMTMTARTIGVPAGIWTRHFQNTSQKRYYFCQLAHWSDWRFEQTLQKKMKKKHTHTHTLCPIHIQLG